MTDLMRAAAQQALEALGLWATGRDMDAVALNDLIFRLEGALAQRQPDPVDEYRKGFIAGQIDMRDREQAEPVQEPVAKRGAMFRTHPAVELQRSVESAVRPACGVDPAAKAEPVQEPDDKAASIRWQLCLLAQTEEFSDDVRNQIGRGVWLIDRLCAALAEPVQEPVAWRTFDGEGGYDYRTYEDNEDYAAEWAKRNPRHVGWVEPLYTAPPQRKPLTEEEKRALADKFLFYQPESYEVSGVFDLISAVERAHGIGGEG